MRVCACRVNDGRVVLGTCIYMCTYLYLYIYVCVICYVACTGVRACISNLLSVCNLLCPFRLCVCVFV